VLRRQREIEPTLTLLRDALQEEIEGGPDRVAQERMREMYTMMQMLVDWMDEIQKLSPETLKRLLKLGGRVAKLLDFVDKMGNRDAVKPDESAPS